jgi:hypothetical protein
MRNRLIVAHFSAVESSLVVSQIQLLWRRQLGMWHRKCLSPQVVAQIEVVFL